MDDPQELYPRLIHFLEDQKQLVGLQKRQVVVRAAGLNYLNSQIDWEGSPRDFAAGLIGVIAGQGQNVLVRFLKEGAPEAFSEGAEPLGAETQAELDQLIADVAALTPAEWESHFLGFLRIIPFMAGDLPDDFVPRPVLQGQIIDRLLEAIPGAPGIFRPRHGDIVGLHGFGGFGKSSLARAISHDPRIRQACPDGVIWVTLGRDSADPIQKINDLGYALTRKTYNFISKEAAVTALRTWLEDSALLFVIDDVWNSVDVEPFLQGGPRCVRLLTARSTDVLPKDAVLVNIGAMEPQEARDVLGAGLPPGYETELENLGDRLGQWPILLQLANSGLREQVLLMNGSMPDALNFIDQALSRNGLVYFDVEHPASREQAVSATVEASLEMLRPEARERFAELGIFPEDLPIPQAVVERLWKATGGLDKIGVQDLVARLFRLALLQSYDPAARSLRIHDVMRDYLLRKLPDAASLHLRLVNLWGCPPKTNDAYVWRWLAYHLGQAALASQQPQRHELTRQLAQLVLDPTYQEQHKSILRDLTTLQGDLELALRAAVADDHPQCLPLVVRLARGLVAFRRRFLRPDHIFLLARLGQVEDAVRQSALFQLDPNWNSVVLLCAAWIAAENNLPEAVGLRDRVAAESAPDLAVDTLLRWVDVDLKNGPEPSFTYLSEPRETLVRALLNRIGGQDFDARPVIGAGIPVETGYSGTLGIGEAVARAGSGEMIGTTSYLASEDWPYLLAYAAKNPEKGMAALEEYLGVFTNYSYPEYRYQSLWIVLSFVVQHPQKSWVKEAVEKICLAALGGTSVEFEEGLGIAVAALYAKTGEGAAVSALAEYTARQLERAKEIAAWEEQFETPPGTGEHEILTFDQASGRAKSRQGRGDSWSYYLRRLAGLAQAQGFLLGDGNQARMLFQHAMRLRTSGKAGYRVNANLALAESIHLWHSTETQWIELALESAQISAHNIQDITFCARMTARVNAMRQSWWPAFSAGPAGESLCLTPDIPEHAAVHVSGHMYVGRKLTCLEFKPEQLYAKTLGELAGLYNRHIYDFVRLNRGLGWLRDSEIPEQKTAYVPDPGFIPHLAARIAAEALVDPDLYGDERFQAVLQLVPMAINNPTALDTVLSRLVLAWGCSDSPLDPQVLAELAVEAPLVEAEPPGEPKARSVS